MTNAAGDDACTGVPAPDASVLWQFDDDAPDAYITSLAGDATEREMGSHNDAAPNHGSTLTGPHGQTYVDIALGDPAASNSNTGTTRTAAILASKHNGYNSPPVTSTDGVCEPGEPSQSGLNALPVVGTNFGCAGTGESTTEDDVSITWQP